MGQSASGLALARINGGQASPKRIEWQPIRPVDLFFVCDGGPGSGALIRRTCFGAGRLPMASRMGLASGRGPGRKRIAETGSD